jgi:glycosyltransferase involved in cell wall biosynthesis
MQRKVSVIIPSYDMAHVLGYALESALAQSMPVEIIVVDDGSKDNTHMVVREYMEENPSLKYFRQDNQGKSVAVNNGIQEAEGNLIALLDADDTLPLDSVEIRARYLWDNPETDAVYGNTRYEIQGNLRDIRKPPEVSDEEMALEFLTGKFVPFHIMSTMYRKTVFRSIGYFDASLLRAHDTDMIYRLLMGGNTDYLDHEVYNYAIDSHDARTRLRHRVRCIRELNVIIAKHMLGLERLKLSASATINQLEKLWYGLQHPPSTWKWEHS